MGIPSRHLDRLAILCVFVSWFFLATLTVRLGSLEHGVRFFEMANVIHSPSYVLLGMGSSFWSIGFGILCIGLLVLASIPYAPGARLELLAACGPLLLMACSMMALYVRTSGDLLAAHGEVSRISGNLFEFANGLARRGGNVAARHIAIGAGGYLGFGAALALAAGAIRRSLAGNY